MDPDQQPAAGQQNSPPAPAQQPASPSAHHQNLSYHQQQLLHQQHLQRLANLHRLRQIHRQQAASTATTSSSWSKGLKAADQWLYLEPSQQQAVTSPQQSLQLQLQLQSAQVPVPGQNQTGQLQPGQQQQVVAEVESAPSPALLAQIQQIQQDNYEALRDSQETAEDAASLKRFRIISLIGLGNYARVYRAAAPSGRELAIKAINLNKTSENYKQKFLPRELNILRRISHRNICKVHEILQIADRIFIIMQYCAKGTVADLLQRCGAFSEALARYLFVPTLDAIVYLHTHELAHRDIKVENILLDQDYSPKLTDFSYSISTGPPRIRSEQQLRPGQHLNVATTTAPAPAPEAAAAAATTTTTTAATTTAQAQPQQPVAANYNRPHGNSYLMMPVTRNSLRLSDTFCGTLPYLSPEMVRQYLYEPKKTDVWSLGVCLYVMLNDRLPFPFNDIKLMVKKQLNRDYKFKAKVEASELCRDLVGQLLEPDFSKRPTSVEALRHPWMEGPRERPQ